MSCVFRCVMLLFSATAFLGVFIAPANANSKYAAYVIHADSGDVYFDRYSNSRRYPASLTKMMTLYLLFEELEDGRLTLDSKLPVSKRATGQPPSKLGVKAGSTIDVETAIEALVIKSANDVAVVVAEKISGSEWKFARKMTEKARALGMSRTTFRNASGLPNSKQVTTARDMATLGQRVLQDFPQYYPYFKAKSFTWNKRTYSTHNALVKTFNGADGIKTGYTRRSGFNLVTTVVQDDQRLIGVVLGGRTSRSRDKHMRQILKTAFSSIKRKPTLVAALHRSKPGPRLKPTLVAAMEARQQPAPTLAANGPSGPEIVIAATSAARPSYTASAGDSLGALIAAADTEDFNEFERVRMASIATSEGFIGEGDLETFNEFSWGVQIGAYSSKALAQDELERAARKGAMTSHARAVLPTPRQDGTTLYRARFMSLSEIEAAAACAGLKDHGVSCFVVADAGLVSQ